MFVSLKPSLTLYFVASFPKQKSRLVGRRFLFALRSCLGKCLLV